MAKQNLTLQNLVEAIMSSIAEAQTQIERQTLDNINEWFEEDGRPKYTTFKLPSLQPNYVEQGQKNETLIEREVNIPLLTLMQLNPIKIKKLNAKFEISLGSVDMQEEEGKPPSLINKSTTKRIKKILSTDLFTGNSKDINKPRQASMEIEFGSSEPTEAYLKLQNELLKLF